MKLCKMHVDLGEIDIFIKRDCKWFLRFFITVMVSYFRPFYFLICCHGDWKSC